MWRRGIGILLILVLVCLNVNIVYQSLWGENSILSTKESYVAQRNYILENTEPDSIIFCKSYSKFLYPERKIGSISALLRLEGNPEEQLAQIMLNLSKENITLYYLKDHVGIDVDRFRNELAELELDLQQWRTTKLYEIAPSSY